MSLKSSINRPRGSVTVPLFPSFHVPQFNGVLDLLVDAVLCRQIILSRPGPDNLNLCNTIKDNKQILVRVLREALVKEIGLANV